MIRRGTICAAVLAALAIAATATADPLDEFGFGGRAAGLAGTSTAISEGADAAHNNPAGVAFAEHPEVMLGYGYGAMQLDINGRDAQVLNAQGGSFGLAIPLRLTEEVTAAFGLALYVPDQFLARIQLIPPTEPHFVLLDNDPHRLVVDPVVSVKIGKYLALGAGASLLTDARGNGISFNVGVISGEKVGESALDAKLPLRVAPLAGLRLTPTPKVRAGIVYRGELSLELALDILANVDVAGVVTGDALVSIRATNYFTPRQVTGGVAVDITDELTVSGDVAWLNWSARPSGVADLRVLVALDVTPPLVQTDVPPADFEDTITGRLGAEYRRKLGNNTWALRGGYAFIPTPVPTQNGLTSFADNDRHVFALGAGLRIPDWKPILILPVELAVGLQWHHLQSALTTKQGANFPGEAFSSGGNIFHVTSSATVSF